MTTSLSLGPAFGAKTLRFGHVAAQQHTKPSLAPAQDTLQLSSAAQPQFAGKGRLTKGVAAAAALFALAGGAAGCGSASETASNTSAKDDTVATAPATPSTKPTKTQKVACDNLDQILEALNAPKSGELNKIKLVNAKNRFDTQLLSENPKVEKLVRAAVAASGNEALKSEPLEIFLTKSIKDASGVLAYLPDMPIGINPDKITGSPEEVVQLAALMAWEQAGGGTLADAAQQEVFDTTTAKAKKALATVCE
ncbi:MAG TPA: hypothetical protein V6C99_06830 [Oculatellaceae cyanobacterium]|jgi:hypothetical protein